MTRLTWIPNRPIVKIGRSVLLFRFCLPFFKSLSFFKNKHGCSVYSETSSIYFSNKSTNIRPILKIRKTGSSILIALLKTHFSFGGLNAFYPLNAKLKLHFAGILSTFSLPVKKNGKERRVKKSKRVNKIKVLVGSFIHSNGSRDI